MKLLIHQLHSTHAHESMRCSRPRSHFSNRFHADCRRKVGVIVGTSSPHAIAAGLGVLKKNGTAADAALAASLAQIVECGGSYVSYAGIFAMMYYDAKSGKVYSLDAAYNTPKHETDPDSIPGNGTPSGRTALVPGYMAGVDAAIKRFGKLPRKEVFQPAIDLADKGMEVSAMLSNFIESKQAVLSRLPEAKRIFSKPDGSFYKQGESLRQQELAATLKKVSQQGSSYMYAGDWAKHFVSAVQREGGKISMADMKAYRASWEEPLKAEFRGTEIYLPGFSSIGGVTMLEALRLLDLADLRKSGHFASSPQSLYWLMQISNCQILGFLGQGTLKSFQGLDLTARSRAKLATTQAIWQKMLDRSWSFLSKPAKGGSQIEAHSDGIVVVDQWGNVAAVTHSANAIIWGSTGIFVDGVSIPDSASFQQASVKNAGPGKRLPDPMIPLIVMKGGKPFLASSTIGGGLHQRTLQILCSMLDFGMDPQTAAEQPAFLLPAFGTAITAQVEKGQFDPKVLTGLSALGQKVNEVDGLTASGARGYWVGAAIDAQTGERRGFGTRKPPLPAIGLAY